MSREEEYEEMLDDVDAGIFSGELLWTNFDMLKEYVERWTNAITAHEELLDNKGESRKNKIEKYIEKEFFFIPEVKSYIYCDQDKHVEIYYDRKEVYDDKLMDRLLEKEWGFLEYLDAEGFSFSYIGI